MVMGWAMLMNVVINNHNQCHVIITTPNFFFQTSSLFVFSLQIGIFGVLYPNSNDFRTVSAPLCLPFIQLLTASRNTFNLVGISGVLDPNFNDFWPLYLTLGTYFLDSPSSFSRVGLRTLRTHSLTIVGISGVLDPNLNDFQPLYLTLRDLFFGLALLFSQSELLYLYSILRQFW